MNRTNFFSGLAVAVGVLAVLPAAQATSLLLDFGPTTVATADSTKSPAHAIGLLPTNEISWNKITVDTNSLVYGDGSAATGISIDLGVEGTGTPGVIDLSNNTFNNTTGTGSAISSGIYSGTSPMRDFIFGVNPGNRAVGFKISGLPAGTYTIYMAGRIGNSSSADPQRFYVTNAPSATTFPFSLGSSNAPVSNPSPVNSTNFVQGNNYAVLTNAIGAGDSLYVAVANDGSGDTRGFLNCVDVYFGLPVFPPKITNQPVSATINEGVTVSFSASASGTEPVTRQWQWNGTNLSDGPNIAGSGTNTLTLIRPTASQAGNYALMVSNTGGTDISSNAVLTVNPMYNTAQMTNIWNLLPGSRSYFGTGDTERGMAFDAVTGHVLVASHNLSNQVAVLDGATGAELGFLGVTAFSGGSVVLDTLGAGDDGVIYAANLTTAASGGNPFRAYRWDNDNAGSGAVLIFSGDPGAGVQTGLRWGDTMTVRGAGTNTQILVSPGSGSNVTLLQSISGYDFQTEVPPLVITVSNAPSAFARRGLAFGPGSNTFWAKNQSGSLYLVQFNIATGAGVILQTYGSPQIPGGLNGLAADNTRNFLAGISIETAGDNVRLYQVSSLVTGPFLLDQETFETVNANSLEACVLAFGNNYLFALDANNGLKAFAINTNYVPPSTTLVTGQPSSLTLLAGRTATFSAVVSSVNPPNYQWRLNGNNLVDGGRISGSATNAITLTGVTTNDAGSYTLLASSIGGSDTSSNAVLTVIPTVTNGQVTPLWNLQAGSRDYLNTGATDRGLAYNPITTNLLIATRTPTVRVAVLNALTGAQDHFLNMAGVGGGTFDLNVIGVGDDGAVYGSALTTAAGTTPLQIYRWADDSTNSVAQLIFNGDPGAGAQTNLRWGDNLAVRGAGANTQILLSPSSGTKVALLQTISGLNFQTEIPPVVIFNTGIVPSGFAQSGIAFGPGANTFWGQDAGVGLYLIQVSTNTGTGTLLFSNTTTLPSTFTGVATDSTRQLLAGVGLNTYGDSVYLYNAANLGSGMALEDQEAFLTRNGNSGLLAALAFGGNYLFALDVNNGVIAYKLNASLPVVPFPISGNAQGSSIVMACPTVAGHSYQVQYRDTLPGVLWTNLGSALPGTGNVMLFTNSAPGAGARYYRIQGQ